MPKNTFIFKHFIINQNHSVMKVGTDAMILGAYIARNESERAESEGKQRAESGRAESVIRSVLDIGTGTGVLSLMLPQRTNAYIDAIDINKNAFLQAKENFENSSWRNRIQVYHSSIQDFMPPDNKKYDLIISNPPYFEHNRKALEESDRYKERSHTRSFDKLSFSELLVHASRLLSDDGWFYVIIPFAAADSFISQAERNEMYLSDRLDIKSKENLKPVRSILGFTKSNREPNENRLVIYKDDGTYTDDYVELTEDYYARDMRPLTPKGGLRTV